jgi:hypothetical protein
MLRIKSRSRFILVVREITENGGKAMQERTIWETIKVQGGELIDAVKKLIHEGNVRRVVIKQGDRVVAEFPLTAGVVGTVIAPILAAVGALAALLKECTIDVERVEKPAAEEAKSADIPPESPT